MPVIVHDDQRGLVAVYGLDTPTVTCASSPATLAGWARAGAGHGWMRILSGNDHDDLIERLQEMTPRGWQHLALPWGQEPAQ